MTRNKLFGEPALALVLAASLGLWLWVSLPMALGQRTVYFRDVGSLHFPLKAFGARELAAGRIPAFNPSWGMGHPFRGNPQALAFYPDNILYLALPFWSAFNLHFALHALLAAAGMAALARKLGASRAGALAGGLAYAGGGFFLTAFASFYHVVAVAAWWPWALLGAAAGGRRGIALGGVACGLALLGGEPLLAAIGLVPLLLVAAERHGFKKGLATAAAVGALGLAVALPQLVATLRILPHTFRGAHGVPAGQVSVYAFPAVRLLELVLPLPFGRPADLGPARFWAGAAVPTVPLVLSIHFGVVGLALALAAAGARRRWAALAAGGIVLAWAGGVWGRPLAVLSAGLFRFPEKFLFWTALAAPLLVAWGLDRALAGRERFVKGAAVAAVLALTFAAGTFGSRAAVLRILERAGAPEALARAHAGMWIRDLAVAGALLALAAWAAHRRSAAGLAAAVLAALLPLAPLAMTMPTAALRAPAPFTAALSPGAAGAAVASLTQASPFLDPPPAYRTPPGATFAARVAVAARELDPFPGVLHRLTYPLAPDVDGFAPPLATLVAYNLPLLPSWDERRRWLRVAGIAALADAGAAEVPGFPVAASEGHDGVPVVLRRAAAPAPAAWWPARLAVAASPARAFLDVSRGDPGNEVVVSRGIAHDPLGRVVVVENAPDRVVLATEGRGGVAVLRRAFQPLLAARAGDGRRLPTFPADLLLTGIAVPPGRQRIVLAVSGAPEAAAFAVSWAALAAAAFLAVRRPRRAAAA